MLALAQFEIALLLFGLGVLVGSTLPMRVRSCGTEDEAAEIAADEQIETDVLRARQIEAMKNLSELSHTLKKGNSCGIPAPCARVGHTA